MACAAAVSAGGGRFLRGGAYKPRTSPYSFQGLEEEGLRLLRKAADAYDLNAVTEVMTLGNVQLVAEYADVLQIGARNVQNFPLLKEIGATTSCPVMLKRGQSATIEEFLLSAEYIVTNGNPNVVLCERGIRTFESATRNTLDINAVPVPEPADAFAYHSGPGTCNRKARSDPPAGSGCRGGWCRRRDGRDPS